MTKVQIAWRYALMTAKGGKNEQAQEAMMLSRACLRMMEIGKTPAIRRNEPRKPKLQGVFIFMG